MTIFLLFDHVFDRVADGASEDDNHYGIFGFFFSFLPPTLSFITGLAGIDLARLADLPLDVLIESRRVAERLAVLQTNHEESSESRKIANRRKALLRVNSSFCHFLLRLRLLDLFGLLLDFFCGRCYPVDSDMFSFFWNLTLVHQLIAPNAINSSVRTFCSTRQGPPGIYWTIPS